MMHGFMHSFCQAGFRFCRAFGCLVWFKRGQAHRFERQVIDRCIPGWGGLRQFGQLDRRQQLHGRGCGNFRQGLFIRKQGHDVQGIRFSLRLWCGLGCGFGCVDRGCNHLIHGGQRGHRIGLRLGLQPRWERCHGSWRRSNQGQAFTPFAHGLRGQNEGLSLPVPGTVGGDVFHPQRQVLERLCAQLAQRWRGGM